MDMKKGFIVLIVIAVIIVAVIASAMGSYNKLVTLEEQIDNNWSQVENQLQRRADLIPNLVETVKGYAIHEQDAIQAVADARTKLAGNGSVEERMEAENELSGALSRLLVVVENYPNLKADANFRQLSDNLEGTENRIAIARKDYNDAVMTYNGTIRRFPAVLIANMLGFDKKEYFEAAPGAEEVPEVDFTND